MSKSKDSKDQKQLFKTTMVPAKPGSGKLFDEEYIVEQGPVECMGMTFENDERRREHFLNILREKLRDPDFRKIEGFPIGKDEDVLALSDPPYHTACPNHIEVLTSCCRHARHPGTAEPIQNNIARISVV